MSDLLRELQYGIPQFGVLIPAGFERVAINEAMYAEAERVWRENIADEEQLAGILAHLKNLRQQHTALRAFGMLAPKRTAESPLPLTVLFTDVSIPGGRTATQELHSLVSNHGATIEHDGRMVRTERVERSPIDGETVTVRTRQHFIPVPDADDKKLLNVMAVVTEAAGEYRLAREDVDSLWELADAVAASFTWLESAPIELTPEQLQPSG